MYDRNTGPEVDGKYATAPIHILNAIDDYVRTHTPRGNFVMAVLENNLTSAFFLADDESMAGLRDILLYVHWEIPGSCHGSEDKVRAWLAKRESAFAREGKLTNRGPWPRQ